MGLSNMVPAEWVHSKEYAQKYDMRGNPSHGYSFPCDSNGKVFPFEHEAGRENYEMCLAEAAKPDGAVVYAGVVTYEHDYRTPTEGKCKCGRIVVLFNDYGHGIDCDCGRIYNMSGQELSPRSLWDDRYDEDSSGPYWAEFGYADS